MKNQKQKIIVILGPTASGKSNLGIFLAKKFHGEIISADSRQVYRGMDIGTGKVTKKEQKMAPHYLLDVANPKKIFTVSDFKDLGEKAIKEILNKKKVPFLVGGTGFYIDALVENISLPEIPPNKKLRKGLEKRTAKSLYQKLQKLDPQRASHIDAKNKRRLIRALEIIAATGKKISPLKNSSPYKTLYIGITWPQEILEKRIKTRLDKRLKMGLVKEVKNLLKSGVSKKRLYDLGLEYRWISQYLDGKFTYPEMKTGLQRDIVRYSKRQMTWFKRNKKIHWLKTLPSQTGQKEAERLVRFFLNLQEV